MIETIRIGRLLRETVAAPYRNLVTRPTGAAVRSRIEEALARSTCHTAFLDFSDIELLDFSCADEVVAKLLMADTGRGVRFLVLQGLREDQHEAIEHVLTNHRLVMVALPGDEQGVPRLLGWVSADARTAFAFVWTLGPLSTDDLARVLGWSDARSRDALQSLELHRLVRPDCELYHPLLIT